VGRRGPKPGPNHLKVIAGVAESRLNREEPVPSKVAAAVAPDSISEGARKVWDRLAPDLVDKGMLTEWDVDTFVVFCEAVATYHECRKMLEESPSEHGKYLERGSAGGLIKSPYWQIMRDCSSVMAQFSSRFGMTPGDRASLKAGIDLGGSDSGGPSRGAERILS